MAMHGYAINDEVHFVKKGYIRGHGVKAAEHAEPSKKILCNCATVQTHSILRAYDGRLCKARQHG